jgi:hypothetical protein
MKRVVFVSTLLLALPSSLNAALTTIAHSPVANNEPSLIGINPFPGNLNPSVLETLYGESNLRRVDDALDVAFRHTSTQATVKAVARFNNPSVTERFAFFEPAFNTWQNVLDFQRVPPAGLFPVGYTVPTQGSGLIPLADSGQVFEVRARARVTSNPKNNDNDQDLMVTFEIIGNDGHPTKTIGNYVVGFELFPNDDLDFQDAVYELSGVTALPEPSAGVFLSSLACVFANPRSSYVDGRRSSRTYQRIAR